MKSDGVEQVKLEFANFDALKMIARVLRPHFGISEQSESQKKKR